MPEAEAHIATYVLVHGGGHGGWCWDRLVPLLRSAGHQVFAPTLRGVAERFSEGSADVDLDAHVREIERLIVSEDLTDVVLVGHSYAGMVISGVAGSVPERIRRLVFVDAAIPVSGEALVDTSPGLRLVAERDLRVVDGVELVLWPDTIPPQIYGLVRPEDIAFAAGKFTAHPWKTMTQKLCVRDAAAAAKIPRAIINCPGTLASRPKDKRHRWSAGDPVWEIDTGNDVMITEPRQLAEMLLRLA
ncbi:MAG: alpha/beta fold hydrolase [Novosphingobium sp.]|nr:alpha/beta fold hydrolase [Novosphingobium sp.]